MKAAVRDELDRYASELGIEPPDLATTMKPEGTLSKVAGGKSPGAHRNRAAFYIRRIRVNAADPVLRTVEAQGWRVLNEVGQGIYDTEGKYIPVTTKVVEFPIASGAKTTTLDVTALDQLKTYYNFQRHYTDHNTSITIDVYTHEWDDVEQYIWDNWEDFVAVSFLERFTDFYPLLPEEVCTEAEYLERAAEFTELNLELLNKFELELETAGEDFELAADDACASGVCPVR
jgi:ribonucleoside-diphosphate reductase alpha chain/ribonucleoside-triphosphate reductase